MSERNPPSPLIFDACFVISLYAAGVIEAVAAALGMPLCTSPACIAEAKYIRARDPVSGAEVNETIDLQPMIAAQALKLVTLQSDAEMKLFVRFASALGTGEAECCALAVHHGFVIGTDDRKIPKVLAGLGVSAPLMSTSGLFRWWSGVTSQTPDELAARLLRIETQARFVPGRGDPDAGWWNAVRSSGRSLP